MGKEPIGAGGNSYKYVNGDKLFSKVKINSDSNFLDLACGEGDYSIKASDYIGENGKIYAIDLWEEGINKLKNKIISRDIKNIYPKIADLRDSIPIEANSIDVCLISSVLHDFIEEGTDKEIVNKVKKVLKPEGKLAVIEFKKKKATFGPPKNVKLSPQNLENYLSKLSFSKIEYVDIGPEHYLIIFANK